MSGKYFKLVALGAVLLHLGDGLLASWSHSHGPHCQHLAAGPAVHHHHGECAGHSHCHKHAESDEPEEHEPSLPSPDDTHHCAACRHLAQAAAHQFVLTELPTVEKVAPLCSLIELAELSLPAHAYQSRGPPTIVL